MTTQLVYVGRSQNTVNFFLRMMVRQAPFHHNFTTSHFTLSPLFHHFTTSLFHHIAISPLHHFTTSPLHHITTSPPHHFATSPHRHLCYTTL
ncbi:MAG: hypothetical protein IPN94_01140 [Sphingobacteriales bacterium]|nr:hypothetical protein [Sphingobacteriales bacterium]